MGMLFTLILVVMGAAACSQENYSPKRAKVVKHGLKQLTVKAGALSWEEVSSLKRTASYLNRSNVELADAQLDRAYTLSFKRIKPAYKSNIDSSKEEATIHNAILLNDAAARVAAVKLDLQGIRKYLGNIVRLLSGEGKHLDFKIHVLDLDRHGKVLLKGKEVQEVVLDKSNLDDVSVLYFREVNDFVRR